MNHCYLIWQNLFVPSFVSLILYQLLQEKFNVFETKRKSAGNRQWNFFLQEMYFLITFEGKRIYVMLVESLPSKFRVKIHSSLCSLINRKKRSFDSSLPDLHKNFRVLTLKYLFSMTACAVNNEPSLSNLISETNHLLITPDKSKQKFNSW